MFLLFLLITCFGCAERVEPPDVRPISSPARAWELLVERATAGGGVDWSLIARERTTLDALLGWYVDHGPEMRRVPESREDERLASLLNMHNALLVDAVLRFVWPKADEYSRLLVVPVRSLRQDYSFRVDAEWTTLRRLEEHRILAIFQDPEVLGGLYRGTADGPRLRYWRAETLRGVLKLGLYDWLNRDDGMRRDGEGWAATSDLTDHLHEFRDWAGAANMCAALVEYASDERRHWLLEHLTDCPLQSFEPENLLDVKTR